MLTGNAFKAAQLNPNPFIKYRTVMYPYRTALARGMSDTQYVELVEELDAELHRIDGTGFRETPLLWHAPLNSFLKIETAQVGQSHKARHLFSAMLYLMVHQRTGADLLSRRLAVASCGNAGLAAAVVAAAAKWPIDVCIPPTADASVKHRLSELGASVKICERAAGAEATEGDPCVTAFRSLVAGGGIPLSVQGPECWASVEGGQTLAWEVASALAQEDVKEIGQIYVQVGGGALGAGLMQGLERVVDGDLDSIMGPNRLKALPKLNCVQPTGNGPLKRAFESMATTGADSSTAAKSRPDFMKPWSDPHSLATGILDDETYDWVELCKYMAQTKGDVVSVTDESISQAKAFTELGLGLTVCMTGGAGLAGLLQSGAHKRVEKPNLVILSGLDRTIETGDAKPFYNQPTRLIGGAPQVNRMQARGFSFQPTRLVGGGGMGRLGGAPQADRMHARSFSFFAKHANPNIGARAVTKSGAQSPTTWSVKGIEYRQLEKNYPFEELFEFNKLHGSTPHNFIPDGPVHAHLSQLATGATTVWGAFDGKTLVGFLSAASSGGYWLETGPGEKATSFVNEFVVDASQRGKAIGKTLTKMSVDPQLGIFGVDANVKEMYTTVHSDNHASRAAFMQSGYAETLTYTDKARDRNTTVMKKACLATEVDAAQIKGKTRVIGLQSGNAVDGIDVGIFEFEPVNRDPADPRRLSGPLKYTTLANKTFSFTAAQRQYVLGLRALDRADGVDYAEGHYAMGEWFGDCVNAILNEKGIDASTIDLIGSHGQSICGHPHWEIGDIAVIAQRTGITTAGDFRPTDVAAGGNGTPCTCTYDTIMLRPEAGSEKWRIAINIGGTASVTFCPPWPTAAEGAGETPLGLDPGLGVFFMDLITIQIDPSLEFDDDGKIGRSGTVHEGLLAEFLEYKYYKQETLPIGVGAEDFPEKLFKSWHARAKELGVKDIDLLTTLTELTAKQIALSCAKFGGPHIAKGATDDVILRGGISNNSYFVERLKANMERELGVSIDRLKSLEDIGLEEASWENAMYAMFGYLCFNNIYNYVPSCTGASRPVVGGKIAPGDNFHSVKLIR